MEPKENNSRTGYWNSKLINSTSIGNTPRDNTRTPAKKVVEATVAPESLVWKNTKEQIDKAYRLKYPTIGDKVSDIGTYTASAMKTLGGSLIGNAINDISPKTANAVSKYTAGLITPTSKEDIETGRLGTPIQKAGMVADGVTSVLEAEMLGKIMNAAGTKIAGKMAGEAIQSKAQTRVLDDVIKSKLEAPKSSKDVINKNNSGRPLHQYELDLMNNEIEKNGVLEIQKTGNRLFKNSIHKAIDPFGYQDVVERGKDILRYSFNSKNKNYITEEQYIKNRLEEATRFSSTAISKEDQARLIDNYRKSYNIENPIFNSKTSREAAIKIREKSMSENPNRVSAYDTFMGVEHKNSAYRVSDLSTNKDLVYTFNPKSVDANAFLDKAERVSSKIRSMTGETSAASKRDRSNVVKISDNEYNVGGNKDMFHKTMGFYNMDVKKLDTGNFEFQANDVWDINPLRTPMESATRNFEQTNAPKMVKKIVRKVLKKIGDIDPYQAYGVAKPMNVKARIEISPDGKIIKVH
jgi:hypothetical protein